MDINAIASELTNDPAALGYAGKSDYERSVLINAKNAAIRIDRGVIQAYEVINATVASEWAALTSAEKQRYETLTGAGQVDTTNANVQAAFLAMFAAGSGTRTALVALTKRDGSRAEQLWGKDATVSMDDLAKARAI